MAGVDLPGPVPVPRPRLRTFAAGPWPARLGVALVILAVLAVLAVSILDAAMPPPDRCTQCLPPPGGVCQSTCAQGANPWLPSALVGITLVFLAGLALAAVGFLFRVRHPEPIPG